MTAHGKITAINQTGDHFWGLRIFSLVFVRPIPKQIWPTKYEDLGLTWVVRRAGTMGLTDSEWRKSVGFEVQGGSAHGFVADAFIEASWGGTIICLIVGLAYAKAWQRWISRKGVWTLVYLLMLALSVFLITQSLGAWLYRLILFVTPTALIWRGVRRRSISRPVSSRQPHPPKMRQPTPPKMRRPISR
jgi:hypothetical protein